MTKVLIIDEENGVECVDVSEEISSEISEIINTGEECSCESSGCEEVCEAVDCMLQDIGINTDNHDEMIDVLGDLKLVRKEVNPEYIEKLNKIKKLKEK